MAAPTIPNGEEHFFSVIYSGNGQGQRVGNFLPFTDNGTIAKSCIFNRADSATMSRTLETATNGKIWTFSTWWKRGNLDSDATKFLGYSANNGGGYIGITSGQFYVTDLTYSGGWSTTLSVVSNRTLEDTSKWYHLMVVVDTTNGTTNNRVKIYIDGDRVTSLNTNTQPSLDLVPNWNGGSGTLYIGRRGYDTTNLLDGYMAETNFVDGTALTPSTFGVTDTSTGRWIPKALTGITYGNSGWRLTYADSSNFGDDTSGNTNDFTATNLTASDQRTDTPTNNLPTMRPYNPSYNTTQAQGNLQYTPTGTNAGYPMCSTLRPNSGKWYAEVRTSTNGGGNVITMGIYIQEDMTAWDNSANFYPGGQLSNGDGCGAGLWVSTGTNYLVSSTLGAQVVTSNPTYSLAAGDVFGIAVDVDNSLVSFYGNNGSLIGSTSILRPGRIMFTAMAVTSSDTWNWNFGDNGTFDGNETAGGNADGDGNGNFYHSVPTGFKMLRQDNMPTTAKGVSGLVWTKNRDATDSHQLYDSSRGKQLVLASDAVTAQATVSDGLQKFLKGGQQIEDDVSVNSEDESYVSWNWVGNSGTTATNDASSTGVGTIDSTYQVNSDAGFSIVQYTGTGSNGTIKHGLSSAPDWILFKNLDNGSEGWSNYHKGMTSAAYIMTTNNSNAEASSATDFNSTAPTSTVFSVGTNARTNNSSQDIVAYCWHSVDGFSKFGKYIANGNADGSFCYTGFKPAFVMVKGATNTGSWVIMDSKRDPFNAGSELYLLADTTDADAGGIKFDFLSNGFKCRDAATGLNASGVRYIYMAFAEHPFVGDGTNPVTAR